MGIQSVCLSSDPVVGLVPNKLFLSKLPVFRLEPRRLLRPFFLLLRGPCWCLATACRCLCSLSGSCGRAFGDNSRLDFRFRQGLRSPGSVWLERRMLGRLGGWVFDGGILPIDTDQYPFLLATRSLNRPRVRFPFLGVNLVPCPGHTPSLLSRLGATDWSVGRLRASARLPPSLNFPRGHLWPYLKLIIPTWGTCSTTQSLEHGLPLGTFWKLCLRQPSLQDPLPEGPFCIVGYIGGLSRPLPPHGRGVLELPKDLRGD